MAIYKKVAGYEGGYSVDPNDTGGETYKGVSRNNFPKWKGWDIIDGYKHQRTFPKNLATDESLEDAVLSFFKQNFWDIYKLDDIDSDEVCYEIYEQSVNLGVTRACKHIQQVCNAMNYKNKYGADLTVDYRIGTKTRARLSQVVNEGRQAQIALANGLNSLQGQFYVALGLDTTKASDYRKYMKGWLSKRNEGYTYE